MLDAGRHPNIHHSKGGLLAYTEAEKVEGTAGDFKVTVRKKNRYVHADKCTGCGGSKAKCPMQVADAFNEGMGTRGAIYSYFAQGIPSTHTIDAAHCRQLNGKKCGICQKVCQADAIDFEMTESFETIEVGAIIAAAGYDVFDPSAIPEYRYNELPNVVTALEFERLLSASGPTHGHLDRPSDIAANEEIADLEKQFKKSGRAIANSEKKFEESSEDFIAKFDKGEYEGDADRAKWAEKYRTHKNLETQLAIKKEKAKSFTVAKKLAFVQCVGSRDFRFHC